MPSIPSVSVIMPVYNGQRYLSESIESVLRQTYRDFEFIIIDDGSSDSTPQILSAYADLDQRVRIVTQSNCGLAASLNVGISLARGEWIARMDADDVSVPDRLEKQLEWLDKTQSDVCGGWTRIIGPRTWRVRRYEQSNDLIKLILCFRTPFSHPTVIMRSSLVKEIGYNEDVHRGQDYDLWVRLALADSKMTNVQRVVLSYRIHSMQTAHLTRDENISNRNRAQSRYVERMIDWPGAAAVMQKFALSIDSPSIDDAKQLKDILLSVKWAPAKDILRCYMAALRYVRPQNYMVYGLYEDMRRRLACPYDPASLSLLTQSLLGLSPDRKMYDLLKRLMR